MRNLLVLLAVFLLGSMPLGAQDSAAPVQGRIVAVGDLHGDYEAWRDIADAAALTDHSGRWIGGDTVLVQMGDITDRGPDSLRIIRHLMQLENEAAEMGGKVVVLLGNHEAMNVSGDLRYVHPGEYEAFRDRKSKQRREATWLKNRDRIAAIYRQESPGISVRQMRAKWFAATPLGMLEHRRAWAPGGELAQWASSRPAIVKIGRTLFAHGGVSAETSGTPLEEINAQVSRSLQPGADVDRSALEDPLGPLWYRGNITRSGGAIPDDGRMPREAELDLVLSRYDANRLVVAHTPSLQGIAASDGGKLVRVDTGISSHYGGVSSYLVLEGARAVAYEKDSKGQWTPRALPVPREGDEE